MAVLYSNNASSLLLASINNTDTTFSVSSGTGSLFPSTAGGGHYYLTFSDLNGNVEIVLVTTKSSDTFTVTRAQDGTSARSWTLGDRIELRLCKAMLDDIKTDVVGSPTMTSPVLGNATATTINKLTLTQPATGSTLTIADGVTLTASANASVSSTNTGDVSIATANGLSISGQALSLAVATNSVPGALSAADHTTFAAKEPAITTGTTAQYLRGDKSLSNFAADALAAAPAETTTTLGALINSATAKTTPVAADMFALMDSAGSNVVKRLSWANIVTMNDARYAQVAGSSSQAFAVSTVNGLTPTALTTGFSIAGGTTSKTLTVDTTVALSALSPIAGPGSSQAFATGAIAVGSASTFANTLSTPLDMQNGVGLFGYNNQTFLTQNAYYNSNWLYKATAAATKLYLTAAGGMALDIATSGAANGTISWSNVLTASSTGLAVTGVLTATSTGATSNNSSSAEALYLKTTGGAAYFAHVHLGDGATWDTFIGSNNSYTGIGAPNAPDICKVSSTGLAVTGTMTATTGLQYGKGLSLGNAYNLNTATTSGFYDGSAASNAPAGIQSADYYYLQVQAYSAGTGAGFVLQTLVVLDSAVTATNGDMYVRVQNGGTWLAWKKVTKV